jgi:thiol:disulfide interchange protein DsbD
MDHFKKVLGLSLLLTGLWLFDVFQSIVTHFLSSALLILTLVLVFFFCYVLKKMSLKKLQKSFLLALPLCSFLYLVIFQLKEMPANPSKKMAATTEKLGHPWEKWSPEKMVEYQKLGQLVFVDFTAKWCFTCIVNEKLVLNTKEFKKLIEEKKVKALHADWTKRDPIIGGWLKKQGIFGLPAYFIQTHNGDLINLGETISIQEIRENLSK